MSLPTRMTETATSPPRGYRATRPHVGVAGPPHEGPQRPALPGGSSSRRRSSRTECSCCGRSSRPFSTRSTSGTASRPHGGSVSTTSDGLHRPQLLTVLGHAFQLIIFFSGIPVVLGLVVASIDAQGRDAAGGLGGTDGALPSPGRPTRRGRHRLELGALDDRRCQPGALGGRTRGRDPGVARRLRNRASGGRHDRSLGAPRALHGAAARRHDARSTRRCTRRPSSTAPGSSSEFFSITLPSLRQEIGVCVTVTMIAALSAFDIVYISTRGGPGKRDDGAGAGDLPTRVLQP